MDKINRLQSRKTKALKEASASSCSLKRNGHEVHAHALRKLINVIRREALEGAKRLRP